MSPENVKRVLFVCIENAGRSQMAEAFARIQGANKVEPYSAGSRPSGNLNPKAMDGKTGPFPTQKPWTPSKSGKSAISSKPRSRS